MIWFTFRVLVDLHLLRERAARQNETAERGSQVRRVQVDSRISYILLRDWRICRKENYNLGSLKKKKKKLEMIDVYFSITRDTTQVSTAL